MLEFVRRGLLSLPRAAPELARYQLEERIGEGGMGVVYAALIPSSRGASRSSSCVGELPTPPDPQRSNWSRPRRPQSCPIPTSSPSTTSASATTDSSGCGAFVYVVMELVLGETLASWLRPGRPWRDVVEVFLAAGRGLQAAHDAGLVHRDFKPPNVLIGRDPAGLRSFGRVCVADFGLALLAETRGDPPLAPTGDSGDRDTTRPDAERVVVGTPTYMALEQHGDGVVEARADQYAFCSSLYRGLSGHRPFPASTVDESSSRSAPARSRRCPGTCRLRSRALSGAGSRPTPRIGSPTMAPLLDVHRTGAATPSPPLAARRGGGRDDRRASRSP